MAGSRYPPICHGPSQLIFNHALFSLLDPGPLTPIVGGPGRSFYGGRDTWVVPATEPGAKEALAASELDYLVLDLRLPLIRPPDLQQAINPASWGPPDSLEAAERRHIALTLRYTGGNRRQAARILGIARSTMLSKLRKYGLEHLHAEK